MLRFLAEDADAPEAFLAGFGAILGDDLASANGRLADASGNRLL